MRGLVATAGAGAVLGTVATSSTASLAAVGSEMGSSMATAAEADNPVWQVALRSHHHHHRRAVPPSYQSTQPYGCYRWGETGYHWYPFCLGPSWLYPHQRVCHRGYCWYE